MVKRIIKLDGSVKKELGGFSSEEALKAEQDYQLGALSVAMADNDQEGIVKAKKRLSEIHESLQEIERQKQIYA